MSRRIVRTTRRIETNGALEPVETVHEREVDRVLRAGEPAPPREHDRLIQRADYYVAEPAVPAPAEMAEMHSWIRALQNVTQRQLQLLREFDFRLGSLEEHNRIQSNNASFERATWWALWGILMLLLGSALAVVLLLILTALFR